MSTSDNTGKRQDKRFKPGHSGNPNGQPKGSLNATTLAAQALLDGEARPRSLLGRRSSLPKVAILRPFAFVSIASFHPARIVRCRSTFRRSKVPGTLRTLYLRCLPQSRPAI